MRFYLCQRLYGSHKNNAVMSRTSTCQRLYSSHKNNAFMSYTNTWVKDFRVAAREALPSHIRIRLILQCLSGSKTLQQPQELCSRIQYQYLGQRLYCSHKSYAVMFNTNAWVKDFTPSRKAMRSSFMAMCVSCFTFYWGEKTVSAARAAIPRVCDAL